MTEFNAKELIISGNSFNKVAKHYNENLKEEAKSETAVTVMALEESISNLSSKCEFDFNAQNQISVMFDELISKNNFDETYGIKVVKDVNTKTFYYPADALSNIKVKSVYLASKLKDFNTNEVYVIASAYKYNCEIISEDTFIITIPSTSELNNGVVYKFSKEIFSAWISEEWYPINEFCKNFYTDSECTTNVTTSLFDTSLENHYKLNTLQNLYLKPSGRDTIKFYSTNITPFIVRDYSITPVGYKNMTLNDISESVEKIFISENVDVWFDTTNVLSVVYPRPILTNSNTIDMSSGNLYIKKKFTDMNLSLNRIVKCYCEKLYIESDFFNDIEIESDTTAGYFGDFSRLTCAIYVNKEFINTELSDDNLKTELKRILKASVEINFYN